MILDGCDLFSNPEKVIQQVQYAEALASAMSAAIKKYLLTREDIDLEAMGAASRAYDEFCISCQSLAIDE